MTCLKYIPFTLMFHLILINSTLSYVVYCPCMGRFGNQAEQFLGVLAFSKALNRTLVLPPFIQYDNRHKLKFLPFESLFDIEHVNTFHSAISLTLFMNKSTEYWPKNQRKVYCYSSRPGPQDNDCNAKDGSPFGPFWEHFGVNFDSSTFYGPMITAASYAEMWKARFPLEEHPVLAFVGAPASYPALPADLHLQRYLRWSSPVEMRLREFVNAELDGGHYVAIHLRNGPDFIHACDSLIGKAKVKTLFSSAQCFNSEEALSSSSGGSSMLNLEVCRPSLTTVLSAVSDALRRTGARRLFVATDWSPLRNELQSVLHERGAQLVTRFPSEDAIFDLALLTRASLTLLNCVSSFSAFAARERKTRGGLPTEYLGLSDPSSSSKEEL